MNESAAFIFFFFFFVILKAYNHYTTSANVYIGDIGDPARTVARSCLFAIISSLRIVAAGRYH